MGTELVPSTGAELAETGGIIGKVINFTVVVAQLMAAGVKLSLLSEQVRATYAYVEFCSKAVDKCADQMASLEVDVDTVSEHRDAATVMRSVLDDAEAMAVATEELASMFSATSAAHQADYGSVNEAATSMPVPMADSSFYSNR